MRGRTGSGAPSEDLEKTFTEEDIYRRHLQKKTSETEICKRTRGPAGLRVIRTRQGDFRMRIGTGYDVHKLVEGRKLILGGVEIPFEKGLLGHSDADVLVHAIMDALLGAAALGDIGLHFPDSDPAYSGADSLMLARKVADLLAENGYLIENVDATVIAQAPKLRPYIDEMRRNIAEALDLELSQVSVKATTEERLGFTGRGEGISAQAAALLTSPRDLAVREVPAAGGGCAACPMRQG